MSAQDIGESNCTGPT